MMPTPLDSPRCGPVEWFPVDDAAPGHASAWQLTRNLAYVFWSGDRRAAQLFHALTLPDQLDVLYVAAQGCARLDATDIGDCTCGRADCSRETARALLAEPCQVTALSRRRITKLDCHILMAHLLSGLVELAELVTSEEDAGAFLAYGAALDHAAVFGT